MKLLEKNLSLFVEKIDYYWTPITESIIIPIEKL